MPILLIAIIVLLALTFGPGWALLFCLLIVLAAVVA